MSNCFSIGGSLVILILSIESSLSPKSASPDDAIKRTAHTIDHGKMIEKVSWNSRNKVITPLRLGQGRKLRAVHVSCYSCMSKEFEKNWDTLRVLYNRPRNFSDLCLDLPPRSYIGSVHCASACLTIVERRVSGGALMSGTPDGYNVARGCATNVFRINMESKVRSLRRTLASTRPMCKEVDAGDIIPLDLAGVAAYGRFQVTSSLHRLTLCTCYGQLCNNQPLGGTSRTISPCGHIYVVVYLCSTIMFRLNGK